MLLPGDVSVAVLVAGSKQETPGGHRALARGGGGKRVHLSAEEEGEEGLFVYLSVSKVSPFTQVRKQEV